jgi:predicted MFS family arabinose efflux permease
VTISSAPTAPPSPTRAIALLALAAFASQAMVRVTDSLLPQIAAEFDATVGQAAIVVTAYAITHGSIQLVIGPLGDRFGKYRTVAVACALSSLTVLLCALAQTLGLLTLARLASGATAAWIIPLAMAYVGDVTPYERRQPVLARFLTGQILGQLVGQAFGGVLGDAFGWRAVFFVLAGLFALAALALVSELVRNPLTRAGKPAGGFAALAAGYRTVLGDPWARVVLAAVFCEGALIYGVFAYVGADLHLRFGLSFTLVGLIVAAMAVGGLIYAAAVQPLVARLGQRGLARYGGLMVGACYLGLAAAPVWWLTPALVGALGLGFFMLHNTLQTNATQMAPEARGTAVALFSAVLYAGQSVGVALAAPVVDRFGAPVAFVAAAAAVPLLASWFAARLQRRGAQL